jgi:hypothetical protein
MSRTAMVSHSEDITLLSKGINRPGREAQHLPAPSAMVKKERRYTSMPRTRLVAQTNTTSILRFYNNPCITISLYEHRF